MDKLREKLALAIETAIEPGSVALIRNSILIDAWNGQSGVSRSEDLLPEISNLLKKNEVGVEMLDFIAVSSGPGSFTGIRVGMSIASGLALGARCACFGISALESLALAAERKGIVRSVVSGGREIVYFQDFKLQGKDSVEPLAEVRESNVKNVFDSENVTSIDTIILEPKLKPLYDTVSETTNVILQAGNLAEYVGKLAHKKYLAGVSAKLQPFYGRGF